MFKTTKKRQKISILVENHYKVVKMAVFFKDKTLKILKMLFSYLKYTKIIKIAYIYLKSLKIIKKCLFLLYYLNF